jgi:hypothetical protein
MGIGPLLCECGYEVLVPDLGGDVVVVPHLSRLRPWLHPAAPHRSRSPDERVGSFHVKPPEAQQKARSGEAQLLHRVHVDIRETGLGDGRGGASLHNDGNRDHLAAGLPHRLDRSQR